MTVRCDNYPGFGWNMTLAITHTSRASAALSLHQRDISNIPVDKLNADFAMNQEENWLEFVLAVDGA